MATKPDSTPAAKSAQANDLINQTAVKQGAEMTAAQANAASPLDNTGHVKQPGTEPAKPASEPAAATQAAPPTNDMAHAPTAADQLKQGQNPEIPKIPPANMKAEKPEYTEDPEYAEFMAYKNAPLEEKQAFSKWLYDRRNPAPPIQEQSVSIYANTYGKDFIIAKNARGEEKPFTKIAWKQMNGNANQDGWKEVIQAPPEVKGLQSK